MSKATIVWVCFIAACATGGNNGGDEPADAAVTMFRDASNVTTPDAPRGDAGVPPMQDAAVSQLPADASTTSGPFCATNSNCTVAGECCVNLGGPQGFCAPGTVVLGQCFPE